MNNRSKCLPCFLVLAAVVQAGSANLAQAGPPGDLVFDDGFEETAGELYGWSFNPPPDCPSFDPTPDGLIPDFPPLRFFGGGTLDPDFKIVFGGGTTEFPGNFGVAREIKILSGRYISLSFTVANPLPGDGNGKLDWVAGNGGGTGILTASISRCPGDFTTGLGTGCVKQSSPLRWRNGTSTATLCGLVPGQRYFLNAVYGQAMSPGVNECSQAECDWLVQTND